MSDTPATIEHAGATITSVGGGDADEITEGFREIAKDKADREARAKGEPTAEEKDEQETAEAAAKLGKKGAAAKKAKPIKTLPDKEDAKAEEASEDEGEEEDEGEQARKKVAKEIEEAEPSKKKRLASERVAEATREAAAAKRELEALKRQFQALSSTSRDPGPAPAKEQFQGRDEEYIEAKIQHGIQRALAQQHQQSQQVAADSERKAWVDGASQRFMQSLERARQADPEVDSKVWDQIADIPPHYQLEPHEPLGPENFVMTEIMASDDPMRLVLHFSENRQDFQRLATLQTPREITREMARLEERLSAPTEPPAQAPSVSKAPPPVRPVTGAPHTANGDGYREGMSFQEYLKATPKGREMLKRLG